MRSENYLDDHGQPPIAINHKRVLTRAVDELIGVSKGILADKIICPEEARYLQNWLEANSNIKTIFGSILPGDSFFIDS